MKIIILHNAIVKNTPDELDVLSQRNLVNEACLELGHSTIIMEVGHSLIDDLKSVVRNKPDLVFNLVEATYGKGELLYFTPAILNSFNIPYTGNPVDSLFITTNKVLSKKIMRSHALPTADFFSISEIYRLPPFQQYIVKPIWEDASVGISEDFIFFPSETKKIEAISRLSQNHFFIETYIDGREFNISILADKDTPKILTPAEMIFSDYFNDKAKIIGYKAKWDENSDEYQGTQRSFSSLLDDVALYNSLMSVCVKTWSIFNLHGYARIDFRVDAQKNIYILEINGNPCIAPDSGFIAACHHVGISNKQIIEKIINDPN